MLLTVGHGGAGRDELAALLRSAGVELVVDVRRFPGSRRNPDVARDELARWLPAAGIGYRWDERLGGRRRPVADSPHRGLRNEQFRAYADHMQTASFTAAADELVAEAATSDVAVLCAETVWWRCHRRMIADAAQLLYDTPVEHLFHDGRRRPHVPTDVVEVREGFLRYPASGRP